MGVGNCILFQRNPFALPLEPFPHGCSAAYSSYSDKPPSPTKKGTIAQQNNVCKVKLTFNAA